MSKLRFPSRCSAFAAAIAFVFVLASALPTRATVLEAKGGPGGGPYNLTCPNYFFMVGFRAKAGAWIDSVSILCALYEAPGTGRLDARADEFGRAGGRGGDFQEAYCAPGEAMKGIGLAHTRGGGLDRQYVNTIDLFCESTNMSAKADRCISSGEGCGYIPSHTAGTIILRGVDYKYDELKCPPEERATGIHGASGAYIDSIGLTCAPFVAAEKAKPKAFTSPFAQGIDIPGSDYRSVVLNYSPTNKNNNQPVACQNICAIEEKCKAWTWVKPGIQGTNAMCWLKTAIPVSVRNANTVSGVKVDGKTVVR